LSRAEPQPAAARTDWEQRAVALVAHELRHVNARLRQRRRDPLVVRGPHRRSKPVRDRAHTRADDDAVCVADRCRLGEHAERALLNRALVVLEEDEHLRHQMSLFPARYSTIFSAAEPSSSMRTESPRGGGGLSSTTVVPGATASADTVSPSSSHP
jgi:hypothetical protein